MRRRKLFRATVAYVVVAWVLIEVASVVLPTFEAPPWVLQAFTFLMILGLPIAVLLAWVYEITPTGLRRDTGPRAVSPEPPEEPEGPDHKTIAVLPFVNLSDIEGDSYFSDGIAEEINSKLARIGQVKVASRTSAVRFRGGDTDVKEIGRQLGVRYVLEGSVRKAGDRVRTTMQLIDSKDGFNLWAEEFDGAMDDIFAVQEEAAMRVAEALQLNVSLEEKKVIRHRYTENSKAYDAYLQGQALVQYTDSLNKLRAASRHFQQALEFDPEYAAALAGLASVEVHIYRNFKPDADRIGKARELADRALSIAPGLARAHVASGEVLAAEYHYAESARRFRDALRIESDDPWTWDSLSWVLGYQQPADAQGAEEAAREAIRIQPQFSVAYYHLGRALALQGRLEEAREAFLHIQELSPDNEFTHYGLAFVHLARGEFQRALEEHEHARLGGTTSRILRMTILAALGQNDKALAELGTALEQGYRDFAGLEADPNLAGLRADSRYAELVGRHRDG
jgi:TolB-like protein